jgi:hypothetical protein
MWPWSTSCTVALNTVSSLPERFQPRWGGTARPTDLCAVSAFEWTVYAWFVCVTMLHQLRKLRSMVQEWTVVLERWRSKYRWSPPEAGSASCYLFTLPVLTRDPATDSCMNLEMTGVTCLCQTLRALLVICYLSYHGCCTAFCAL